MCTPTPTSALLPGATRRGACSAAARPGSCCQPAGALLGRAKQVLTPLSLLCPQMCEPGCRLFGSPQARVDGCLPRPCTRCCPTVCACAGCLPCLCPTPCPLPDTTPAVPPHQLKAFVAEQVDPGWYPHVTVTQCAPCPPWSCALRALDIRTALLPRLALLTGLAFAHGSAVGREPHFVVFNEAGSALYERDVEYMSSGALQYMLTTFGFHRNDTKGEGGGDPRNAARGSLKGHARTAVATRARLRAAAAAAKAAEEAEQQAAAAAEAAAKAAREEEARKLEENSKRSAEEALAQGKGNATVNTPLDAPASAQPKVAEVAQPHQQAPPPAQQQQQQQPAQQAKAETPKPPAPEQQKAAPAQQQQQAPAGGGNQTRR